VEGLLNKTIQVLKKWWKTNIYGDCIPREKATWYQIPGYNDSISLLQNLEKQYGTPPGT
jgi:hypothetical protein